MPDEHLVLVDAKEAHAAWEPNKKKWLEFLLAKYAKTAVKTVLANAVNHFTFNVAGALFEAPSLIWTARHLEQLGEIRDNNANYGCECHQVDQTLTCADILSYIIEQKQKKGKRRLVGVVPVVGTFETVRAALRSVTKQNKGHVREQNAKTLRNKASNGCPKAQAIVAELLGNYRRQESWEAMFTVCEWEDGWKVLNEKMAST
jgi:lambda repressor-like predicted transcriptional regulator